MSCTCILMYETFVIFLWRRSCRKKRAVQQVNIEVHVTKSEYHQWYVHPWIENNFSSLS